MKCLAMNLAIHAIIFKLHALFVSFALYLFHFIKPQVILDVLIPKLLAQFTYVIRDKVEHVCWFYLSMIINRACNSVN